VKIKGGKGWVSNEKKQLKHFVRMKRRKERAAYLDSVLEAVKLPASVTGLDTGLSHVDLGERKERGEEKKRVLGNGFKKEVLIRGTCKPLAVESM